MFVSVVGYLFMIRSFGVEDLPGENVASDSKGRPGRTSINAEVRRRRSLSF